MAKTIQKNYIQVPKEEYLYLKNLQKKCEDFLDYAEHLKDIHEARNEIKEKKVIKQEALFKKLGI